MKQYLVISVIIGWGLSLNLFAQDSTSAPNNKWLSLSAGLTLSAQFYKTNNINPRQQPFMYSISGAPALDLKGVSMPFSVMYSNQVFAFQQPFNLFGIAPKFKFGTVYLGTSSLRFSQYSLAGQRILGAGADLQFKWLRLGAIYGRLRRQVNPIGGINDPSTFLIEQESEAFNRNGYAVKIGFGKQQHYFDIIYFKAFDVIPKNFIESDWLVKPRKNVVFAIASQLKLGKKLILKNDWGVSAITRNTLSDTVEIDNAFLEKLASSILLPQLTSQVRLAGESQLKWNGKHFSPSINYKRIELDYTSLGAYYFLTDIQQFTGAFNSRLLKNKINFSASFGRQNDNLQKQRLRTSYRNIGAFNLNYTPSSVWGVQLNYSNFGITQSPLPKSLSDSTRINQVNNSLTLVPRLIIQKEKSSHTIIPMAGYSALSNLGASIGDAAANTNYNFNLSYNWQYLPAMFNLGVTPGFIVSQTQSGEFAGRGASVSLGKMISKGKFQVNYSSAYFANQFNGIDNGYTLNNSIGFSGNIPKWPSFNISAQQIINQSNNSVASQSFNEVFVNLSISFNF